MSFNFHSISELKSVILEEELPLSTNPNDSILIDIDYPIIINLRNLAFKCIKLNNIEIYEPEYNIENYLKFYWLYNKTKRYHKNIDLSKKRCLVYLGNKYPYYDINEFFYTASAKVRNLNSRRYTRICIKITYKIVILKNYLNPSKDHIENSYFNYTTINSNIDYEESPFSFIVEINPPLDRCLRP